MKAVMKKFNINLATSYLDSASVNHAIPLHQKVRDNIEAWRELGSAQFVLDWIQNGVYFEP